MTNNLVNGRLKPKVYFHSSGILACMTFGFLILACSCSDGRQKGQFAVTASGSQSVEPFTGALCTIRGHALNDSFQRVGPDNQPLLNVLIVCPGLKSMGGGGGERTKGFQSLFYKEWFCDSGNVKVEFAWNRKNDIIIISGNEYDRKKGAVFSIVRRADGSLSVFHIANSLPSTDKDRVIQAIKMGSNDPTLSSLSTQPNTSK